MLALGSGDVSLFAVQFAKLMGCRVIVSSSNEAKAARLRALGADEVVDYAKHPEWAAEVRRLTGGEGADLVIDTQGPATIGQSFQAVAGYGHIVLLRVVGDEPEALRIMDTDMLGKLPTLRREFVGNRVEFEAMNRAVGMHRVRPVIDREFGFSEALEAFRYYLEEESFGKVVVRIGED